MTNYLVALSRGSRVCQFTCVGDEKRKKKPQELLKGVVRMWVYIAVLKNNKLVEKW